jgi:hypothetical protein
MGNFKTSMVCGAEPLSFVFYADFYRHLTRFSTIKRLREGVNTHHEAFPHDQYFHKNIISIVVFCFDDNIKSFINKTSCALKINLDNQG